MLKTAERGHGLVHVFVSHSPAIQGNTPFIPHVDECCACMQGYVGILRNMTNESPLSA
jgi:hypothetical protein